MILILKGLLTHDDRQGEMDKLIDIILSHRTHSGSRNRHRRRRRRREVETSSEGEDREEESEEEEEGNEKDSELEREDQDYSLSHHHQGAPDHDSPRIVFDQDQDSEEPLPSLRPLRSGPNSRSNSRTRGGPRRSFTGESNYSSTSGYASPILSTSPTEGALDLSGLGYALSRVREEPGASGRGSEGGGDSSSDGLTPTASQLNLTTTSPALDLVKPARRRSLFGVGVGGGVGGGKKGLLGRSNSNSSQVSQDEDLAVSGVMASGGGSGGGEKLRRNLLLRRNSSRNSTITMGSRDTREREMVTVLGGKGLSMEDD